MTADVTDMKSKNGICSELEIVKSHNIKLAEDMNKKKTEIDKQFVPVAEELTDVRCLMVDTQSHMFKFVDDKANKQLFRFY